MSEHKSEFRIERNVPGKPEDVYYAFTTAQGWRDWLSDAALMRSFPGGSFHLSWDRGWHASGTVKALERPGQIQLTWRGQDDPADTQVEIQLKPDGDGTRVELVHRGFGEGDAWEAGRKQAASGWEIGLENLESIFDSGADLRVTRQPMLGIMGSDFNEKIASQIGVPVDKGVRIQEAVEGMGPAKAGMQGNDVIVEMDGTAINDWPDMGNVLRSHRAGDKIAVSYYRGDSRNDVEMELSARPIPDVPLDPPGFAARYRIVTGEVLDELKEALEGVSEAEADFAVEGEWSIKENIAHLIENEQANQVWFRDLLIDNEPQYGDPWENRIERYKALVRVTPTLAGLVERLASAQEETCGMIEESREQLSRRKGVMWRAGLYMLHFPGDHEREHIEQMQKNMALARAALADPA